MSRGSFSCSFAIASWCVALAVLGGSDALAKELDPGVWVETSAFRIRMPQGWKLKELSASRDSRLGFWVLSSKTRNSKLYVRLTEDEKGSMRELFNGFVNGWLRKRVRGLEGRSYRETKDPSGKARAIGSLYGIGRRNKTGQRYKYTVIVGRNPKRKRVAYLVVAGTDKGWPKQQARFDQMLQTFDVR